MPITEFCRNFAPRTTYGNSYGLPLAVHGPREESPGNTGQSPSETEVIREGKQTAEENNRRP